MNKEWWLNLWYTIRDFFVDNVWKIVGFIGALVIGLIVIKILVYTVRKVLGKTKMEKIGQQFLVTTIKFLLYLVLVLILLSIVGIAITGIITALSAVLLAIGMALESNIANLANGIVIVSTHMFKKGDYIIVNGTEGHIDDINFLFTTLVTNDNKKITMPNSTIVNSSVVNAGANPTRRVDFTFSVAYESDCELVKKIVKDVMLSSGLVLTDPAPFCRLKELGASSIDFFANCWCDSGDYWDVYYYVMENVYNEFKRNNISIPYNQLEVRERKDHVVMPYNKAKLPARVEKVREEKSEGNLVSEIFNTKPSKKLKKEKKTEKVEKKATKTKEVKVKKEKKSTKSKK